MAQLISTKLLFDQTAGNINKAQFALFETQRQISSGQKHDSFDDLVRDVTSLKSLKDASARLESYTNSINRVITRVNLMETSLDQLTDRAVELSSNISLRRSPTGDSLDLEQIAEDFLDFVEQILNTTNDGVYIFGGTKNASPPIRSNVQIVTNYDSSSSSPFTPNANYYTGNSTRMSLRVSDGQVVEYGVTGDNAAFKNLIAAAHLAREAHNNEDPDIFNMALEHLNSALDSITALRAQNGNSLKVMEDTRDTHERALNIYGEQISKLVDTDVIEATLIASLNETKLQATFQTFASISRLRLMDFL